jgi:hypothetical protein
MAAAIAVGRGPIFGVRLPFYDIARVVIPGVDSILGIVRLFIFMQLALVLAGTVALAWIFGSIHSRPARLTVAVLSLVVVVLDSRLTLDRTEVPRVADGSVYAVMQELDPGKAVELPIPPQSDASRPYLESTRMLLGAHDDLQIVNGHSGYWPVGHERTVGLLNQFPSPASIEELKRLGVEYVILHSAPLETGMDLATWVVNNSGYAFYEPDELSRVLADLPHDSVVRTWSVDDGVVVQIR